MAAKKSPFSGLDRNKTLAENTVNAGPVVLDSNVKVASPDGTGFSSGALNISLANATLDDHLSIAEVGGITLGTDTSGRTVAFYEGVQIGTVMTGPGGLTVLLGEPVDDAAMTALARAVAYSYTGDAPPTAARTVTFRADQDEATSSIVSTMKLKLKAENDAPEISSFGPVSSHTPAAAGVGVVIDGNLSVADPDGVGFKGGKLVVHVDGATADDTLYLSSGPFSITGTKLYLDGKVVGSVSGAGASGRDLAITFKGNAAISDAQITALAEQVSYRSTATVSESASRQVTFTFTDAQKSSTSAHVTLAFDNEAPAFLASGPAGGMSLVSVGSMGQGGDGFSQGPIVSPDGNKVAFWSSASNLPDAPAPMPAATGQIFVKDLGSGSVTLVSSSSAGAAGNSGPTDTFAFSADSGKVAFVSYASNLVDGDTNETGDIFVKDLATGTTTRISTDAAGGQANSWSHTPVFSADGTRIAFVSGASNLVAGDTNGHADLFIKDLATGVVTRISSDAPGAGFAGIPSNATFSPDGSKIAFFAFASEVSPGIFSTPSIYLKDLATGEVTLASGANASDNVVVFSPDGTKVAFLSDPWNVIPGAAHASAQLFVKDLTTGELTLVSSDAAGIMGNGLTSGSFAFSPDGTSMVFSSASSNLVPGDTEGISDIFIKDLTTGAVARFAQNPTGMSFDPTFSPDGAYLVFASGASNLVAGDTNGQADVFMLPLAASSVTNATLTEDAAKTTLTVIGTVYYADRDAADTHAVAVVPTSDTLGTVTAKVVGDRDGAGAVVWTYTVDEAKVEPLAAGETRTETFTLILSDGYGGTATQDVTVTLTGTGSETPAVATFARAAADSGAAKADGADLWASVTAILSGINDDLGNHPGVLEARVSALGSTRPHASAEEQVAPFADFHLGALNASRPDFAPGFKDLVDTVLDQFPQSGAGQSVLGAGPADGAEAIAARLWNALHMGQDEGHSLI
ncbi:VCBS domain-containing protein [Xanthobacter autotrophicus DSM 431]|uniref:VCBS domain-containing protein n=1 Tax=Xanthobacter nonsaccharivorans TaxID=3119912 RepID=UPI00372ACA2F